MKSLLLRDIEHWTKKSCSFTTGAAQVGDLVVPRHGGTVREVTRVLPSGYLWTKAADGHLRLITRPEEFRTMKRGISIPYTKPIPGQETRIGKPEETLDI